MNFQTNLYDFDGCMTFIRFYDDNGKFVLSAYFDKSMAKYDIRKGKVVVPANGIKIENVNDDDDDDDDYYDNNSTGGASDNSANHFRGSKVLYMSFSKKAAKNLHYIL